MMHALGEFLPIEREPRAQESKNPINADRVLYHARLTRLCIITAAIGSVSLCSAPAAMALVATLAFLLLVITAGARAGSHGGDPATAGAAVTMTTRQSFGTLRFAPVPPSAPSEDFDSYGRQPPEDDVGWGPRT
jgi:hypothetical protein